MPAPIASRRVPFRPPAAPAQPPAGRRAVRPAGAASLLRVAGLVLAGLLGAAALPAAAQPRDATRPIGPTVADAASPHYRFERFTVSSPDGRRTWRVRLGIPRAAAPARGFPAFWMLDGNAALVEFDPALLAELAARPVPQVLVFVGYDNDLRIDLPARTRDYTPFPSARSEAGPGAGAAAAAEGGGADAFLETIERAIGPEVARRVAVDPARRSLWGHSLGGLFALHALYTRSGAFATYAAGSPSLWWGAGRMLGEPEALFAEHNAGRRARLLLALGGAERAGAVDRRDLDDARVRAHLRRIAAAPPDAAAQLARRLAEVDGLQVEYREFPGLGHGPMLRASLLWALHAVAGVTDRSGAARP